jgi:hypothetical protein
MDWYLVQIFPIGFAYGIRSKNDRITSVSAIVVKQQDGNWFWSTFAGMLSEGTEPTIEAAKQKAIADLEANHLTK